jgi:hypothetical protein
MADVGDVYLGITGLMLKLPAYGRTYSVTQREKSRVEEMASGRLCKEVIATKKRFVLSWSMIDGSDLTILNTIYSTFISSGLENLVLWTYETAVQQIYDVHMEPVSYDRIVSLGDGLWGGVSVTLDEV